MIIMTGLLWFGKFILLCVAGTFIIYFLWFGIVLKEWRFPVNLFLRLDMKRKVFNANVLQHSPALRIVRNTRRVALFFTTLLGIVFLIGCYVVAYNFCNLNENFPVWGKHIAGAVFTLICLCALLWGVQDWVSDYYDYSNIHESQELLDEVEEIDRETQKRYRQTGENLRRSKELLEEIEHEEDEADWWKKGEKEE